MQRPTEGLEFLASYTYSKALSDNVGYYGVGWGQRRSRATTTSTAPIRCKDYGPSPYDMRHNFSLAANYELPFGKGRKIGSDWSGAEERDPRRLERQHHLPVHTRPSRSPSTTAPVSRCRRPARWSGRTSTCNGETQRARRRRRLDRHQLLPARARRAQFGDSGVGILRGPGYWNWDLGLSKNFYLDDKRYLSFRASRRFNVLNHPNFADPGRVQGHRRTRRRSGRSRTRSRRRGSWSWC